MDREPSLHVFYDGWCPRCRRLAALGRALDRRERVAWHSLRDPETVRRFGLDPAAALRRLHAIDAAGHRHVGFAAVVAIARRLPAAWPLLPLLWALEWAGLGERLYDALAAQRRVEPPRGA